MTCPRCGGSGERYHWSEPDITEPCGMCGGTGEVSPEQLEAAG